MAQRAIQGSTYECQRETWPQARRQKGMYQKKVFGEKLKPGERVSLFAPRNAKSKNSSFNGTDRTTSLRKRQRSITKFQRMRLQKKWHIVHYKQLKPVKDDERSPRMETRSFHYEKLQSQGNAGNNKEMANDENIQSFTPEFFSRPQKQHSRYKWMDEDKNFFYDLFAERTNTTKTLTKKIIPTEPSGEEQEATELSQHVLKEIQTPFVTPTKELSSTPLPQRPHKPKVVMRDLNEGKKTPASATR